MMPSALQALLTPDWAMPIWRALAHPWLFWGSLGYVVVWIALGLAMGALSVVESRRRARQSRAEDFDVLHASRFMLPVSVVAPALNEEAMVVASTRSLLEQDYPEFEVVVVDDGSTDGTLARLAEAFDLEQQDVFYRDVLPSAPVRAIYRSRSHPRLTVVSKVNAGTKADAVNCGVNLARFPYVCSVDGDTLYLPDALINAMSQVTRDPAHIVGATSFFGVSSEPDGAARDANGFRELDPDQLCLYQHLDLMRSFLAYRLALSRLGCMLCNPGAFALWRRDVLLALGGFSPGFTCEDIEMTFRVHEHSLRNKLGLRILSLPYVVAETEGPRTAGALVKQRARWQRVLLETVWAYKFMLLRPRYRSAGLIGLPYYVLFEALGPLVQILSLLTLLAVTVLGLMWWPAYLAMLSALVFATTLPTTVAIRMHDAAYRDYRPRDLARMLLMAPLDLFLYRPIILYAGLRGTIDFLRGNKGWDKFERNERRRGGQAPA